MEGYTLDRTFSTPVRKMLIRFGKNLVVDENPRFIDGTIIITGYRKYVKNSSTKILHEVDIIFKGTLRGNPIKFAFNAGTKRFNSMMRDALTKPLKNFLIYFSIDGVTYRSTYNDVIKIKKIVLQNP